MKIHLFFFVNCFVFVSSISCGLFAKATTNSNLFAEKSAARRPASGELLPVLDSLKCRMPLEVAVVEQGISESWAEQAPTITGARAFRAPTRKLGTWLELNIAKDGRSTLFIVDELFVRELVWNTNCEAKTTTRPGFSAVIAKNSDLSLRPFDDNILGSALAKKASGIVYVWSPGMSFSAMMLKTYRNWAKRNGHKFIAVVDPVASLRDVLNSEKAYGFTWDRTRLNSVELHMRNATVHFPTTIVFNRGRIHRSEIVGVMSTSDFQIEVKKRLSDL